MFSLCRAVNILFKLFGQVTKELIRAVSVSLSKSLERCQRVPLLIATLAHRKVKAIPSAHDLGYLAQLEVRGLECVASTVFRLSVRFEFQ